MSCVCVTCVLLVFVVAVTSCQEEDELPDDETINQMIARSEDEFDRYQIMDVERKRAETIPGVKTKSRLVEEDDLPPWLIKDDEEVSECVSEWVRE